MKLHANAPQDLSEISSGDGASFLAGSPERSLPLSSRSPRGRCSKWVARHRAEGEPGLLDRSCQRPQSIVRWVYVAAGTATMAWCCARRGGRCATTPRRCASWR